MLRDIPLYARFIMYHPKLGAGILYTIPNFELGYCVSSQGMYWYILEEGISGLKLGSVA